MDNMVEKAKFTYTFNDEDDGSLHKVTALKEKECITAEELCEMFLQFMTSAGYSENNVWDYFKE